MSADDVSRRWLRKQAHYQDPEVVARYEASRFESLRSRGDTARMLAAARRLLGPEWERTRTVLDLPCGTGRFLTALAGEGRTLVAGDLSQPMLLACAEPAARKVRADATRLPFADASFDLVLCMRFLFHVPPALQQEVLREVCRVTRGALLVDVRHSWAFSAQSRRLRGALLQRRVSPRTSPLGIDAQFRAAGLEVLGKHWFAPGFSEKVLVLSRPLRSRTD
ncbi:MAG: class I SAM-dependent methyltransferase [Planctomycetia bacterium]